MVYPSKPVSLQLHHPPLTPKQGPFNPGPSAVSDSQAPQGRRRGLAAGSLQHGASSLPCRALARLIRQTARQEWPLLLVMVLGGLVLALGEGLPFAVIFQAARLVTGAAAAPRLALPAPRAALRSQRSALTLQNRGVCVSAHAVVADTGAVPGGHGDGWAIALLQSQSRPRIRVGSRPLAEGRREMASGSTEDIQI